jgi:hypothetical protein
MKRPLLCLSPSQKAARSSRRARNQFRAWVVSELNKRGANLEHCPKYVEIRDAIEKFGIGPTR